MTVEKVHQTIGKDFPAHLEAIREFVRMPSISADGTGMAETADAVKGLIEEVGGQAQVVPTKGHPIVYGEVNAGKPKTLLILGMYDVMPVEGEDWMVPPFGAEIVDLPEFGPCVVSRGIYNSKGPLRSFFNVLSAIQKVDSLPVNVKFVIEGEEEQGSRNLPGFVDEHLDWVGCDAVFFPYFTLDSKGRLVMYLGCKGVINVELTCQGGDWGGPRSRGIHSSMGAWIASPTWKLIRAMGGLVDDDERITIDGFYDEVTGPSAEDRELLGKLEDVFDETVPLRDSDAARFKYDGLHGAALLEKYLFEPTINVNGIVSGHTGEGGKTVMGHKAVGKMDIRLVPNMTVEGTKRKLRNHLACAAYRDVQVDIRGGYPYSRTSVKEPVVQALIESYRHHGYEPEVWPHIGGSGPFYIFREGLGVPLIGGGLCHGGNAHSPNEYAVLGQMELFAKSLASFLYNYADMA
jgi:acetylornithine deacetylase/succinyl-diaminopimelate desuccinylase-like protein